MPLTIRVPPQLPLDILINIFSHLPASREFGNDDSVITLVKCLQVNSLFYDAASVSNVWEHHYRTRYLYPGSEELHTAEINGRWKLMYAERRRTDKAALHLLNSMVSQRPGRYDHAKLLGRMSFAIWDVLDIEADQPIPSLISGIEKSVKSSSTVAPHALTRVYWARSTMQAICRTWAVQTWVRMKDDHENSSMFVEAFSAISCFFGKPPSQMSSILADLVDSCRTYLLEVNCPLSRSDAAYDLSLICTRVCEFMESRGFGSAESQDYHSMMNHFPHAYLTTNKHTIPLSLAHIFIAIAQGLGIAASPVNFPAKVLVHVASPEPTVDDIYVDVYGAKTKAILSLRGDIPTLLSRMGVTPQNMMPHISPCGAVPMLLRATRNIMTSSHTTPPDKSTRPAILVAYGLHLLLTKQIDLVEHMTALMDPIDCATFPDSFIPALGQCPARGLLDRLCKEALDDEADTAALCYPRSAQEVSIQYFVGMFFQHRKYGYFGCICRWDPTCMTHEDWIRQMDVDSLPRGRNQPFYTSLTLDGSERYVAEDNIQPIEEVPQEVFSDLYKHNPRLPMYFSDVDWVESEGFPGVGKGRFLLSPEVHNAYPEDDIVGRAWMAGGLVRTT